MTSEIESILSLFSENGYAWSLRNEDMNAKYSFTICRNEWITNDIYQARPLPYFTGDTIISALVEARKSIFNIE